MSQLLNKPKKENIKDYLSTATDEEKINLFRLSIKRKSPKEIVELILSSGVDINCADYVTSFALAIRYNRSLELIKKFRKCGAGFIQSIYRERETFPLFNTVHNTNLDILKYLISEGADINQKVGRVSLLFLFCKKGKDKEQFIEYLIGKTSKKLLNKKSNNPLSRYLENDYNKKIFELFLKNKAKLVILNASGNGVYESILVSYSKNPNFDLQVFKEFYQLVKGHQFIKEMLIQSFQYLVRRPNIETIDYILGLMEEELTIKVKFEMLYHSFYDHIDLKNLKYLLEERNFPLEFEIEKNGFSVLHLACLYQRKRKIIEYLLTKNCTFNIRPIEDDYENDRNLLVGHYLLGYLFDVPYRFNQTFIRGWKKKLTKDKNVKYKILKLALQNGLDPNLQTKKNKFTAFAFLNLDLGRFKKIDLITDHLLVQRYIKLLLKYNADPWLKNGDGLSFFTLKAQKTIYLDFLNSYLSIVSDFHTLLEREENTDFQITSNNDMQIKIHSIILLNRIDSGLSAKEISQVLSNYSKIDLIYFLKWVYGGYDCSGEQAVYFNNLKIALKLGLTKIQFEKKSCIRGLLIDLKKLFNDQKSKNFTIMVPIEKNEEVVEKKTVLKGGEEDDDSDNDGQEEVSFRGIQVHREILQARSELYRGLFSSIDQSVQSVKDYTNKSYDAIRILVYYIYNNNIDMNEKEEFLTELFDASEYFQLSLDSSFREKIKKVKRYQRKIMREYWNKEIEISIENEK
ncbi:ankyrin repeat-containing protein [Anaeramoeba flamelloides]|uniref:Ankyrin repeat-containing protein n=1 Tax=Anaeramoeba flamelloides TaxID=1746091 RepID=A0ABQ8Y5B0_9EUKA|nr:ankyrin repeat-containing protein [Anaeramoeba flamelloides]